MKKVRILQVPPIRFGIVLGLINGVIGMIVAPILLFTLGAAATAADLAIAPKLLGIPWLFAGAGALFMPLLLVSVWGLSLLPPPSPADEAQRVKRAPMGAAERRAFLAAFGPGVALLVLSYVLLTAFRDFRDNFAAEIWKELGYGGQSGVFSASELPVAVAALAALAMLMVVRDNRRALMVIHAMIAAGFVTLGVSTLAFEAHLISPLTWMILTGAGLYMAYTPFNAMLFDRLIAFSGRVATAGFLIYLADASGYVGSVGLMLWRNFGVVSLQWLPFFNRDVEIGY